MPSSLRLLRLMPCLFWALISIVTILLLIELAPKQSNWPYLDKVEHIVVFAMLSTFGGLAYPSKKIWIYFGLAFYGLVMELLQGALTITRMPSVYDWIADILGILLSIAVVYFLKNMAIKNN